MKKDLRGFRFEVRISEKIRKWWMWFSKFWFLLKLASFQKLYKILTTYFQLIIIRNKSFIINFRWRDTLKFNWSFFYNLIFKILVAHMQTKHNVSRSKVKVIDIIFVYFIVNKFITKLFTFVCYLYTYLSF